MFLRAQPRCDLSAQFLFLDSTWLSFAPYYDTGSLDVWLYLLLVPHHRIEWQVLFCWLHVDFLFLHSRTGNTCMKSVRNKRSEQFALLVDLLKLERCFVLQLSVRLAYPQHQLLGVDISIRLLHIWLLYWHELFLAPIDCIKSEVSFQTLHVLALLLR